MTPADSAEDRQRAVEVVRKRLHDVLPQDREHALGKTDHQRDLNANCKSLARWIVDDVLAALAATSGLDPEVLARAIVFWRYGIRVENANPADVADAEKIAAEYARLANE